MSAPLPPDNRHLVPRWRSPADSVRAGELSGSKLSVAPTGDDEEVRARRSAVDQAQGAGNSTLEPAFELLAAALANRDQSAVRHAAEVLGDHAEDLDQVLATVTRSSPENPTEPRLIVGDARRRLRVSPFRPLAWLELARGRVLLGQPGEALRAIRAARQLAPDHRLVIRAESRLYVHCNEFERAHDLLARHPRTASDPWLRATELAVAELAERRPRYLRSSRTALLAKDWTPAAASELAAAVSTAEHLAGDGRRARRLIKIAIDGAHDNAIAQAQWLVNDGLKSASPNLDEITATHAFGFEARARRAYYESDWQTAYAEGERWQADQAFATLPARFLSLVGVVGLDRPDLSLEAAARGLAVNDAHLVLLNNAAFAAIINGDLATADDYLRRAAAVLTPTTDIGDRAALTATTGLLAYRLGLHGDGRRAYEQAAAAAARSEQPVLARAVDLYHYWVRRELGLPTAALSDPTTARFTEPIFETMRQRVIARELPLRAIREAAPTAVAGFERAVGDVPVSPG